MVSLLHQSHFQITLSSLPFVFGTTLETIPDGAGYLKANPAKIEDWRIRLSPFLQGRKSVGLVWHGRPTHANNANRSVPLGALTPVLNLEDKAIVSLQVGQGIEQLAQHPAKSRVFNASPLIKDFDDTAALMSLLDCVVTIDSGPAHLAGALGRQTLLMLPRVGEWRWLEQRSDSPWYPTMTVIRPRPGDNETETPWDSVVAQVLERLDAL